MIPTMFGGPMTNLGLDGGPAGGTGINPIRSQIAQAMMPRAGPYLRPQMPRPQIQPQLGAMTPFGQPAQPGPRMGIQPVRGPYA